MLYEAIAVILVAPVIAFVFDHPTGSAFGLAIVSASIALTWNYVFNLLFERWEARQPVKGRSLKRRIAHGIGFEGGLVFAMVPLIALWLRVSPLEALATQLSLLAFFFVYTIVFTWSFDTVFGLPDSAK